MVRVAHFEGYRGLVPDDAPLGDLLVRAAGTLRRSWGEALEPWGLSPHQARALRVAAAASGPLRVSDLAGALHIAPRSATEVVDGLEGRGLLERATDPGDRRAVLVRLTGAGRATHAEVEAVRSTGAKELFARLDDADRAALGRILRRLADGG